MRILLDTNIVIHREASTVVNEDIGVLFRWLDNLHHTKCIHPVTIEEIEKHQDPKVRKSFEVKLEVWPRTLLWPVLDPEIVSGQAPILPHLGAFRLRL